MSLDFSAAELFDLSQSLAGSSFTELRFAWEILTRIEALILELGPCLKGYERKGEHIWVGKGTRVAPSAAITGPAIIGCDCEIRHGAFLRGNVIIGDGAVIGNCSELKNAILFNKTQVPHFNYVGDSVLGFAAHLGAGVILSNVRLDKEPVAVTDSGGRRLQTGLRKFGALIGDRTEIGCNSVLNPGTVVGRECIIYPLSLVGGVIPPRSIRKPSGELIQRPEPGR